MNIQIYNQYSFISDFNQEELDCLTENTKITVNYMTRKKGQRHPEKKSRIVSYLNRDQFPTGLLPRTHKAMRDQGFEIDITDMRVKPPSGDLVSLPEGLFDDTNTKYAFQNKAVEDAVERGRGLLHYPTGSGKTVIMAKIIDKLKLKTIVIVPNLQLLTQTHKNFCDFFGEENVDSWGGGHSPKDRNTAIVISTQQTLFSLLKNKPVEFRFLTKDFDLMLLDECHHVALGSPYKRDMKTKKWIPNTNNANSWYEVGINLSCFYRLGMSATLDLPESPNNQFVLEAVTGRVVSQISVGELVDIGVLCPIDVVMIEMEHPTYKVWKSIYKPIEDGCGRVIGKRCVEKGALDNNILDNDIRNGIIASLSKHHQQKDDRVLILFNLVESQGEKLKRLLPDAVFLTGGHSADEREQGLSIVEDKNKILLGTIFKEGFDKQSLNVLFIAGGGKTEGGLRQNMGRIVRGHDSKIRATLYDFMDRDGSMCERHSEARRAIYEAEPTYSVRLIKQKDIEELYA